MKVYYHQLYGIPSSDLEEIKDAVSKKLNMKFNLIESEVWGDYYRTVREGEDNDTSIYENHSPEENEPHRPDYAEFPILISIYDSTDQPFQREVLTTDPDILAVELETDPEPPEPAKYS